MSGSISTAQQDVGSGTSTAPFNTPVSGLKANTIYYFEAYASNSVGTAQVGNPFELGPTQARRLSATVGEFIQQARRE